MIKIQHRFSNHQINPETEILIIGTFNPETPGNEAEYFYGRRRNNLWRLLPTAFGNEDLKEATVAEKVAFTRKHKIDFTDLIDEIVVEAGQEANYDDRYIDSRVSRWRDVLGEIDALPNLRRVCFTRKTFTGIPNMKIRMEAIRERCEWKEIDFRQLITPARFYRQDKQDEWSDFLRLETD